ncbi:MAG: LemA family protein [Treponema sp.]|nr:LemA family protein [Treponema sp.]MBR0487305.1 LemA family protein [Treponema sp.]
MNNSIKKILITVGVIAIVAIALYSCTAGNYNKMVTLDEEVSTAWSQVQNQYQRRMDLIPNLVSTVQGYAKHEAEVLTQIAEARAQAGGVVNVDESILNDPEKFEQYQKIQNQLGASLQRLLAVTENYPELKANENFLALQDELAGTENRIAVERKNFNEVAKDYNTMIRKFPQSILAGMFGFEKRPYFTASEEAQSAPQVQF